MKAGPHWVRDRAHVVECPPCESSVWGFKQSYNFVYMSMSIPNTINACLDPMAPSLFCWCSVFATHLFFFVYNLEVNLWIECM